MNIQDSDLYLFHLQKYGITFLQFLLYLILKNGRMNLQHQNYLQNSGVKLPLNIILSTTLTQND